MEKLTKDELLQKCLDTTDLFKSYNDLNCKEENKDTEENKKIKSLSDLIGSEFGCERDNVRKLVNIICDIDIPAFTVEKSKTISFKKYACFILTGDSTSHDYPINEVCMALSNSYRDHYRPVCSIGNNLSGCGNYIRPATKEEIEDFVDICYDHILDYI